MGFGRLNVWITQPGNPNKISDAAWCVKVMTMEGTILQWATKTYKVQGTSGHVEIDQIPPGNYWIGAFSNGPISSSVAMISIRDGETVCVTLYVPSYHFIASVLKTGLELMEQNQILPDSLKSKIQDLKKSAEAVASHLNSTAFEGEVLKQLQTEAKSARAKRLLKGPFEDPSFVVRND